MAALVVVASTLVASEVVAPEVVAPEVVASKVVASTGALSNFVLNVTSIWLHYMKVVIMRRPEMSSEF